MLILFDLPIGLSIDITGGYKDSKLAMTQARDQAGHFPDANAIRRSVTFGFNREIDKYRRCSPADTELTNSIPSAVSRRPSQINGCNVRQKQPCKRRRAMLESVVVLRKVLTDKLQNGVLVGD